jgi:hypothetical protein
MTHPILQISAFIALTFVLIYLSRKPLLNKEAHGFTRFFAWEAILALLVTERTGLARAHVCTHSIVILVTLVYFSFTGFFGIERIKNFRASKWPSARQQFVQV